jgi:hypothetical protein
MTKMPRWLAKFCAVLSGLFMFALTFLINLIGADMLAGHLRRTTWVFSSTNYPLVVDYERVGRIFLYAYPATVGVAAMFFFWRETPRQTFRIILYLLILALIGPLTFINYLVSDQWLNLWIQSAFNLFVAFVGYVVVLRIRNVPAESADAKALQSISMLFIASLLVARHCFTPRYF